MNKKLTAGIVVAVLSFIIIPAVQAFDAMTLNGKEFQVVLYCTDEAGDYCDSGDIRNDEFEFDGSDFIIKSFEDELFGYGGEGDYNDGGLVFSADYEVITDDLIEKYKFDIQGYVLAGQIIIGTVDIDYYEWDIIDFDKEDEAMAYFVGLNR